MPLSGSSIKVTPTSFLIGLSGLESDAQRNLELLSERSWLDIPVVYGNGRRAIIAMEKGTSGERAFAEAFKVWSAPSSAPQSLPRVAAPVQQPAQPAVAGSQPDSSTHHKTPLTPQRLHEGLQKHQFTRFVASAANQPIGFFHALNPDCTNAGPVNIRITKQPEHGAVNVAAATGFSGYAKDNLRYKCNQHRVKGMQINYKSTGKYIGGDAVEALVLFPDGFAWEVQYEISVR